MLVYDSNIVICACKPSYPDITRFVDHNPGFVSAVTVVEALGYHKLSPEERKALDAFFALAPIIPISTLVTRNTKDFEWVPGLRLFNPLVP